MSFAPEPFFAAYTDILRTSILTAKSIMIHNTRMIDNVKKVTSILDAVSGIPDALYRWSDEQQAALKKRLEYFDALWAREEGDFSLMKIYRKHIPD